MAFVSLASDQRNSCCKGKFNHFSLFSDKLVLYLIVRQKCFHDDKKKKKKKKPQKCSTGKVLRNWYHQHAWVFDDNIFVVFGGRVFQQTVGITYGYKLCSYSHRLVPLFVWGRLNTGASQVKRKAASPILNFTFRYIDDVLSLNNSWFGDFVDRIYPIELEIKDTTETDISASYLDLHLEILRQKRWFQYSHCELSISNIPAAVYIS